MNRSIHHAVHHKHHLVVAGLITVVAVSCSGRDPLVAEKNEDAIIGNEGEGEGEAPAVRTLTQRALFGTLPVENRFIDPLFTMGSSGWYAVNLDFTDYGAFYLRALNTPSQTRAMELAGSDENPDGVMLLGQYKSSRAPQIVSIWLSAADPLALESVTVSLLGVFVDGPAGAGEQSVDLSADAASERDIDGRTWVQYSAVMEEGPIGWASFMVESQADGAVLLAGPLAIEGAATGAGALVRSATPRTPTAHERAAANALAERNRTIGGPLAVKRAIEANSARRTR